MSDEENKNIMINEAILKETLDHLKELNDKRDEEIIDMSIMISEMKKDILGIYGSMRIINMLYYKSNQPMNEISILISSLYLHIEDLISEHLL